MALTGKAYRLILGGVKDIQTLAEKMDIPLPQARKIARRLETRGFVNLREAIDLVPRSVAERKFLDGEFKDEDVE